MKNVLGGAIGDVLTVPGAPEVGHDHDPQAFVAPNDGFASNGLPIYDWFEAADQLTRENLSWSNPLGDPTTVTYAFRSTAPTLMPNGTSGFSRFTADQIQATEIALQLWADVANIVFQRVGSGTTAPAAFSNSASILFANYSSGATGAAAFAYLPYWNARGSFSLEGDVWVNYSLADNKINVATMWGNYGLHTLAHEIGHAIGLSHPGDYDGGTPTYPASATYWQDSRAYTIMSYFGSSPLLHNLNAYSAGPQLHDIAAAQRLYGANMNTRTTDTIYGWNSNTGSEHFDINTTTEGVVFAVWDAGGTDTFDFSGYSTDSEIDLREESFSSVGPGNGGSGVAVGNVAIARGVTIENAIGGSGNDTIIGNAVANVIDGGAGADSMTGGGGDDTYIVDNAGDTITELADEGTDTVQASFSFTLADHVENLILGVGAINGTGNAGANSLTGNTAANILNGLGGADTMTGGLGDDSYYVDNIGDSVIDQADEGTDTVYAAITYALGANVENLTLTDGLAINGTGNGLANIIVGTAAANILNGGAGADTLSGGGGNDTYIVDDIGDIVSESINDGTDTVQSSIAYTLTANVENLTLTGGADLNGTGNGEANTLNGNSGVNTLNGLGGVDQLFGGGGNDVLDGGTGADFLYGGEGDDAYYVDVVGDQTYEAQSAWGVDTVYSTALAYSLGTNIDNLILLGSANASGSGNLLANVITGNSGANILYGFAGNDTLDGGTGIDQMYGGEGDDTYYIDNASDQAFEAQFAWGADLAIASVSYNILNNIDNLTITGSAFFAKGNTLNNVLTGTASANELFGYGGNDVIDGGAGADNMYGGEGDDTYYVDNAADFVFEAQFSWGTDLVYSAISYNITGNIDNLTLTGSANNWAKGNALGNALTGNSGSNELFGYGGNDVLDGGAGADAMYGAEGDDTYYVDNAGDITFEGNAGWGADLTYASVSHTLGSNIDNLILTGSADLNGTGNGLANVITGNSGANALNGAGGADTLNGGLGNDTLTGGGGNDAFVFVVGSGADVVTDFVAGGADDTLDLSAYDGSGVSWDITQVGADTLFSFSNGDTITLSTVDMNTLVVIDPYHYG